MTKQELIKALEPYNDEAEVAIHHDGETTSLDVEVGLSEDGQHTYWESVLEGSLADEVELV